MIGRRPSYLATVALMAGMLGSMNDMPKAVSATKIRVFDSREYDNRQAKRQRAKAARRKNRQ